ncbi:uncharacterized protein FRV6_06822 [Fusarium oxysporum]|uniref:Uncharacterized protein n=1 Tax=Fusarium oxysporum TaxID=5507 RepID=A0A2H3T4W6_FUSOX|nr:uncharacterized protein FRV6_06822 [Fusarium oxysporum]
MSSTEAINKFVKGYAQLFKTGQRSPILRRPDEYGWFIPALNSQKLIIANHPTTCNRYGFPGYLEGYGGFGGFEVNFLPDYKNLNDAGSTSFVTTFATMASVLVILAACAALWDIMKPAIIGLLSRCLGGNATIHAMTHFLEYFKTMKAMVLLQAVSGHAFVEKGPINSGLDKEATVAAFDKRIHELTGFWLAELTPLPLAKNVTVPTLFAQVRRDTWIDTSDSQQIFDALGSKEKKMV